MVKVRPLPGGEGGLRKEALSQELGRYAGVSVTWPTQSFASPCRGSCPEDGGVIVEDGIVVRGGAAFGLRAWLSPPPVPLSGGEGASEIAVALHSTALPYLAIIRGSEPLLPLEGELSRSD